MVSHRSASAPTGVHVQGRARPALGDQHAEVLGRTGDALRGVVRTPRPRRTVGCAQLDEERLLRRGQPVDRRTRSPGCAPRCARSDRSRAVAGRFTPSASATSRPCAQVSISRAVAIDAALIGGPNHGSLRPSATVSSSSCSRARVARQSASSSAGGVSGELLGARVDETGRVRGRLLEHRGEPGFVGDRL